MNEVETIEILSKTVHEKEEHLNKLQGIIDGQTIRIRELEMIETTLTDKTSRHRHEIQEIQQKHQRVNSILGNINTMNTKRGINQLDHADIDGAVSTVNEQNVEWTDDIDVVDHHVDVMLSVE